MVRNQDEAPLVLVIEHRATGLKPDKIPKNSPRTSTRTNRFRLEVAFEALRPLQAKTFPLTRTTNGPMCRTSKIVGFTNKAALPRNWPIAQEIPRKKAEVASFEQIVENRQKDIGRIVDDQTATIKPEALRGARRKGLLHGYTSSF